MHRRQDIGIPLESELCLGWTVLDQDPLPVTGDSSGTTDLGVNRSGKTFGLRDRSSATGDSLRRRDLGVASRLAQHRLDRWQLAAEHHRDNFGQLGVCNEAREEDRSGCRGVSS